MKQKENTPKLNVIRNSLEIGPALHLFLVGGFAFGFSCKHDALVVARMLIIHCDSNLFWPQTASQLSVLRKLAII